MADAAAPANTQNAPANALFYVNPHPLSPSVHPGIRLRTGNFAFARDAVGVPLVFGEFAQASHHYPILFAAGEDGGPVVLTGLDKRNLFVKDDQWDLTTYIPAYVRRYPFGFVRVDDNGEKLALAIDLGCSWVALEGDDGRPLFENGQPTQLTNDAMQFCTTYSEELARTRDFMTALRSKGLLVDRQLDGTLPDGKKFTVNGFQLVDEKKLTELDADTVVDWHRKGYLATLYFHLASLERVNSLIQRQASLSAPPAA